MKIMIVGSGGREYSMGLVLAKDPEVTELFLLQEMVQHQGLEPTYHVKIMTLLQSLL